VNVSAAEAVEAAGVGVAASAMDAVALSAVRREARLWYWQRISGMVLTVCVVVHLIGIIYAVRGGLSAVEILGRTRGSWMFAAFYGTFVVACAVHAPIGLSNVLYEWRRGRGRAHVVISQLLAAVIAVLGFVAVYAVVAT
jgi:succinate dehydrogenase subunit C